MEGAAGLFGAGAVNKSETSASGSSGAAPLLFGGDANKKDEPAGAFAFGAPKPAEDAKKDEKSVYPRFGDHTESGIPKKEDTETVLSSISTNATAPPTTHALKTSQI